MKNNKLNRNVMIKSVLFMVFLTSGIIAAQGGPNRYGQGEGRGNKLGYGHGGMRCEQLLNLTEDQKTEIENLKIPHRKEMLNLNTQLMEKRAKLNTLLIADNPDMKAINSVIEDMGKTRTAIQKGRISHRMKVRSLLNDEQKVIFDANMLKGRKGMGGFGPSRSGRGTGKM